jgi:hypothetical protein
VQGILAGNDRVAGITDCGNTHSGDAAYDLADWQFFWDTDAGKVAD